MWQKLRSMGRPTVVEGQIEVCLEATGLLGTREEERAEIHKVPLARALAARPKTRSLEEEQTEKVKKALGIKDFYEEQMERDTSFDQTDEQLADVLYALYFVSLSNTSMLESSSTEAVAEGGGGRRRDGRKLSGDSSVDGKRPYTIQELQKTLKEVFDVDDATIEMMYQDVRRREKPQINLHLNIIEAKDLRPKTSKGVAHPFCKVKISKEEETSKTHVVTDTLAPVWNSEFSLAVSKLQDAKLVVEVWHEPGESSIDQLVGMQNWREISRSVIGNSEMKNLMGIVTVPLENLENKGRQEVWYNLVKMEETKSGALRESFRMNKKRGSLHLGLHLSVSSQLNLLGNHWYDILLNKLLQHQLGFLGSFGNFTRTNLQCSTRSNHSTMSSVKSNYTDNSDTGSSYENETASTSSTNAPWAGIIGSSESFILSQYGAILNMTPPLVTLSWWKITSKLMVVDQSYLGDLLKKLFHCINQGEYSEEELKEVKCYLRLWASFQDEKLRNLHLYFSTTSRIISHLQLTHTLRNLKTAEDQSHTLKFKIFPRESSFSTMVTEAVTDYTKNWWEKTLQNCGNASPRTNDEQQLEAVISVTCEVYSFFKEIQNFYEAIFKNEAGISYLKISYVLLSVELAARIRPLLLRMYESPTKTKHKDDRKSPNKKARVDIKVMDEGTSAWQLYKKLECIVQEIGERLPEDIQEQSDITCYHKWFLGVIKKWQEQISRRASVLVSKEVGNDTFEVLKEGCKESTSFISVSAREVSFIFQIVKTTWLKLAWPCEVDGDVVENQLLDNLCNLGTHYAKLIVNKLHSEDVKETYNEAYFLPTEICIALNNIEYMKKQIRSLPELLQLHEEADLQKRSRIIERHVTNMESFCSHLIDSSIIKMKPNLTQAVITSCEIGNDLPLLSEVLDGELCHLKQYLDKASLQRVLFEIWKCLVLIFQELVNSKCEKQKPEYFNGVYKVLESTWHFFTPLDLSGLDPQLAYTSDYDILKNYLADLKLETPHLIAKYYRKRYDEQQRRDTFSVGDLIVHVFFTRTDKLHVEVVMARNISESGNVKSFRNPLVGKDSGLKQPDTYVQVRLVPQDWFPNVVYKTKIVKKNISPVYGETFELNISAKDHGAKVGLLHFVLKTSQILHGDGILGEVVLPLDTVICVDLAGAAKTSNSYLSVNTPKHESEYSTLKALKFRYRDKKAVSFLKELRELRWQKIQSKVGSR